MAAITKKDCGSTMDEHENTCFFNSLFQGLKNFDHIGRLTLIAGLALGAWPATQAGKMVCTQEHESNLETLANNLEIRIAIYRETVDNTVDLTSILVFGQPTKKIVRIVKLRGCEHYNLITGFYGLSNAMDHITGLEQTCYTNRINLQAEVARVMRLAETAKVAKPRAETAKVAKPRAETAKVAQPRAETAKVARPAEPAKVAKPRAETEKVARLAEAAKAAKCQRIRGLIECINDYQVKLKDIAEYIDALPEEKIRLMLSMTEVLFLHYKAAMNNLALALDD